MKHRLNIDIETYSSTDLKKCGVYKYAAADDFDIILFSYSLDGGRVETIDLLQGAKIPTFIVDMLFDPEVLKIAFNAAFERVCLTAWLGVDMPPEQWQCTMVLCAMAGLPMNLGVVARVLKLEEQKDARGKVLIRYFSMPCKPSKVNGGRTRNMPHDDLVKWMEYCEYNRQDVVTEMAVADKLSYYTVPENEHRIWHLDQHINDRGVRLDHDFVKAALHKLRENDLQLVDESTMLTGLQNTNSLKQLKEWLEEEGIQTEKLTKAVIPMIIEDAEDPSVIRVLQIRQELAKTSCKKYVTMLNCIGNRDRARGLIQYGGAGRTLRFAGRLIQVQNLPKNYMKDLWLAREVVKEGNLETMQMMFGNVPDTLSQLLRTSFMPATGHKFYVSDYSAIEARIIAWLSGEKWRIDVFNTHGKIYEASAAAMFKVPLESISYKDEAGNTVKGPNYYMRQNGKVAELALGYAGGVNALISMGALAMGIEEDSLPGLVKLWRKASPKIVNFWYDVDSAALEAVRDKRTVRLQYGLTFQYRNKCLFIKLPSGRELCYYGAYLGVSRFGGDCVKYWGMLQSVNKWDVMDTYGGKLVENIVQAIARDCLAEGMLRLDAAGFKVVMHIHDEVVIEAKPQENTMERIDAIMSLPVKWAPGLKLPTDGYVTDYYYKKD